MRIPVQSQTPYWAGRINRYTGFISIISLVTCSFSLDRKRTKQLDKLA
ncbi:MAG: hypothetical protein H8E71_06965 [Candidatus Marinimicrobia bacterium]|nr:hypothetical protein [Candidatus Neomarinimicrobiota bacterium]